MCSQPVRKPGKKKPHQGKPDRAKVLAGRTRTRATGPIRKTT